jgi:hypothetical protein
MNIKFHIGSLLFAALVSGPAVACMKQLDFFYFQISNQYYLYGIGFFTGLIFTMSKEGWILRDGKHLFHSRWHRLLFALVLGVIFTSLILYSPFTISLDHSWRLGVMPFFFIFSFMFCYFYI